MVDDCAHVQSFNWRESIRMFQNTSSRNLWMGLLTTDTEKHLSRLRARAKSLSDIPFLTFVDVRQPGVFLCLRFEESSSPGPVPSFRVVGECFHASSFSDGLACVPLDRYEDRGMWESEVFTRSLAPLTLETALPWFSHFGARWGFSPSALVSRAVDLPNGQGIAWETQWGDVPVMFRFLILAEDGEPHVMIHTDSGHRQFLPLSSFAPSLSGKSPDERDSLDEASSKQSDRVDAPV